MAKGAKRKAHLVYIIEVPRAQPLNAVLPKESERADKLLNGAMTIASKVGCEAVAEVVQARDAGPAIVEEARDHNCAAIFLGIVRNGRNTQHDLGKTIPYVLTHACCRVLLVQDPCPQDVME
jgi:nucleotide-binding universal stress UspA family protein